MEYSSTDGKNSAFDMEKKNSNQARRTCEVKQEDFTLKHANAELPVCVYGVQDLQKVINKH